MDISDQLCKGYRLTTIEVVYYMPDYTSVLNEFIWQTMDIPPEFRRIHKFLNYWKNNIEAVIKEVNLAYHQDVYGGTIKQIHGIYRLN